MYHERITIMNRTKHRLEVLAFLQENISCHEWKLTLPSSGQGHETYIAQSEGRSFFIKLGARVANYQAMTSLDLTPAVVLTGCLADGVSIMVQEFVVGRNPSWRDFQFFLDGVASIVNNTHHNVALKAVLPPASSSEYVDVGLGALRRVQRKWEQVRPQVPSVADYVDATLVQLKREVQNFTGAGLVASHNDICNVNWLFTPDEKIYLVDLEAMSLDDPAHDMGSLLWWYYPPELRQRFLTIAGYEYDEAFKNRMRVRMALHCLDIILPRALSFDLFDAAAFPEWLTDFRAIVAGEENPQGYDDD